LKIPVKIIEPRKGFKNINFSELFSYRDLLMFMVLREIKVLYKQTILGFSWAIIRPLFSMIIFSLIFGKLAKIDSNGIPYPLFSYMALVPWVYFSTAITKSTQSLINSSAMLSKVYFPRLIIPFTPILSGLVDFIISLIIVFVLMFWYGIKLNAQIIIVPYLIFIMIITSSGIGMWLSAMAIQYRDIRHGIQFLAQLLMYAAPVVWPSTLLIEKFGNQAYLWYSLYPMVGVIEGFRASFLGFSPIPWDSILIGSISAIVIFFSGVVYFNQKEKLFADVC